MKKVLALVMIAALVLCIAPMMATTAIAASGFSGGSIAQSGSSGTVSLNDDGNIEVAFASEAASRKAEIKFLLPSNSDNFAKLVDAEVNALTWVQWKSDKYSIRTWNIKGNAVIDGTPEVKNIGSNAVLQIKTKEHYATTNTDGIDWAVRVTVYKNDKKNTVGSFEVSGNWKNDEIDLDEDYYDWAPGGDTIIKPSVYIKKVEIDAGADVTVFAKMFNNRKYYARAYNEVKDEDDDVFNKYLEMDEVIYLDSIGLQVDGNVVKLGHNDKSLIVYDKDLNRLGTTVDSLPVTSKYYIASKELDIDDEDLGEPDDGDGDEFDPGGNTGGDDVPENVNDNPGTGR